MFRRCWLLGVCLLFLVGCSGNVFGPAGGGGAPRPQQEGGDPAEWDLYEPVVRSLLTQAEPPPGGGPKVAYISLDSGSAPAAFCRRFAKEPVQVRAVPAAGAQQLPKGTFLINIQEIS